MKLLEAHMTRKTAQQFEITIKGKVQPDWSDWFDCLEIAPGFEADGSQTTILTGMVADQAALRGILNRLWDMNLSLISVRQKRKEIEK